jgi:rhodanese-related sulfurtransferase
MSFGQSLAYKTLLKGYYDKDFPIVYPDQADILGRAILLDTREKEEFEVSHLKGAKWVGYDTFTMESLQEIPKDQPIVVYCSIGARSQDIGKRLKSAGFKEVYNLYGGIFHWVNEDNPVYKNDDRTEEVHVFSRLWGIWLEKGKKVY